MSIGFSHKAVAHLAVAIAIGDTQIAVHPTEYGPILSAAPGDYVYLLIRGPANRELVKVTVDLAAWGGQLTITRGQGGTTARAWPVGSMLFATTHADHYNSIVQRGENRVIGYNPNTVLSPLYTGEKVYQTGESACQKRWWKSFNGTDPYWDIITGDPCNDEDWKDIGFDYDLLMSTTLVWSIQKDLSLETPAQNIVWGLFYDPVGKFVLAGVGADAQIWKSTNGTTWTLKKDISNDSFPVQTNVYCFAQDTYHDVIVAGTGVGGQLWVSDDDGETWAVKKKLGYEVPNGQNYVYSLCFDPSNNRLIAGTGNNAHIYVSDDGGETWTKAYDFTATPAQTQVNSLVYDPFRDQIVAGTGARAQIWVSDDGGDSWTKKKDFYNDNFNTTYVRTLTYDPGSHNIIAGTSGAGEVFLSEDGGATWAKVATLANTPFVFSSCYVSATGKLYVGGHSNGEIWVSSDNGENWELEEDLTAGQVRSLVYDAEHSKIFAGTGFDAQIFQGF